MGRCDHVSSDAYGGQQRALGVLGLEIQVAVSHSTWVLGGELRSSEEPQTPLTTDLSL